MGERKHAPVAKLADAYALGAYGETLRGSIPLGSTLGLPLKNKYILLQTNLHKIYILYTMTKALSNEYLQTMVSLIDAQCLMCHKASTDQNGKGNRHLIRSTLTDLGRLWDHEGAEGTNVMNTLKKACDNCLADGRVKFRLFSLTCGIATRLPEHLNHERKNNTSR